MPLGMRTHMIPLEYTTMYDNRVFVYHNHNIQVKYVFLGMIVVCVLGAIIIKRYIIKLVKKFT
jgi:hypothetical protein